ncbi:hypothetical protein N7455_012220 [Penicillium solitum]|uniref:uncharacterized protein n=1 Tax=Penicillium solitum TaxID=60172 RepID=UPI0032C3E9AA|nr:hypothetical protein N7455_012220 [Penicillium solitum]
MSANSGAVPDVWEDSWENQADKLDSKSTPPSEKKVSSKVTKAQRRAEQAEFNRQLWAEAAIAFIWAVQETELGCSESTETFHFVEARADVPLKQDFKPAVTLLSRKPQLVTRHSSSSSRTITAATAGLGRLGLDDDDDSDDDTKPPQPTPEERHAIALKNREEKQRKYEEVRERLFGSPSATASGTSSPGSTTPPRQNSTGEGRGRGKGRGGGRDHQKRDSSSASSKSSRHLYDPSTSAKSNGPFLQRGGRPQVERSGSDTQAPQQPMRSPRGPDASGRGGFNFNRGARTG